VPGSRRSGPNDLHGVLIGTVELDPEDLLARPWEEAHLAALDLIQADPPQPRAEPEGDLTEFPRYRDITDRPFDDRPTLPVGTSTVARPTGRLPRAS
jgi:hypothetical protein